jgi:hypothetical protein
MESLALPDPGHVDRIRSMPGFAPDVRITYHDII